MKEDCRVVLRQAYLYLDGEILSEAERVEIRHHLEECRPCLERYGLEKEVTSLVARLRGKHSCPERVKARIQDLLEPRHDI
ncbi:MAG: mycothiol system anti-sigma-R factor [Actinomycetota bacterium]|nr:mycothiol system anti-sigma-R factor [Actinomycetota bacterium]